MKLTKQLIISTICLGAPAAFWFAQQTNPAPKIASDISQRQNLAAQSPKINAQQRIVAKTKAVSMPQPPEPSLSTEFQPTWYQDKQAVDSFVTSLDVDDPRAPPINRSHSDPSPSEDVLNDPQLYAEHEAGKRRKLLSNYIDAAQQKQQKLQQLIAKGQEMGIEAEKLEEGLRKLEALKKGMKIAERELGE